MLVKKPTQLSQSLAAVTATYRTHNDRLEEIQKRRARACVCHGTGKLTINGIDNRVKLVDCHHCYVSGDK